MTRALATVFCVFLLSSVCRADPQARIKNQVDKDSYSLGYTFGKNIRNQGLNLNTDILVQAARDGLEAKPPAVSPDEIRETVYKLEEQMRMAQGRRAHELAAKNLEDGKAFLDENKKKQGVETFPDGLQYKVLEEGKGPSPKANDMVTVNYRGSLLDGTLFDSSYTRGKPSEVRVDGVVKGWTEALEHMKTGSKWEVFVPPELAYGARQYNQIPPNSTLIFEIELLSIAKGNESKVPGQGPAPEPNPAGKKAE
ncbi:MAG: FKBP-type peptidyl-prolyl cis-trans isomerase [Syntrophobacteraceae bacterium]|jgi:FKBP-type peptidyl-prolyl cis-trans isomerase FklB